MEFRQNPLILKGLLLEHFSKGCFGDSCSKSVDRNGKIYFKAHCLAGYIGRHGKKHCQNKFDNPQGSYQPKLDLMKQFRNQVDGFPVIKLNSGLIYCRISTVNCQFKFKFSPESVVVWRRTPMLRWSRWRPSRRRSR